MSHQYLPYAKANKTIRGEKGPKIDPNLILFIIVLFIIAIFDLPCNP